MHGNRNREVVRQRQGLRFHHADDGGNDLFVHHSAITGNGFKSLAEGATVSYDTEQGREGQAAANVRVRL
jgi:cold shock protein